MTKMTPFYNLGLCGCPLDHSLSPIIQRALLKSCKLEGDYSLFSIPTFPAGQPALLLLLDRLRRGEINGLNVTIPHKQNVINFLDDLTPAARAIGAVNTIFFKDEKLTGDNTDAPAFLSDLTALPLDDKKDAILLGAGGAARAVAYILLQDGWQIHIASRRPEQAEQLARSFGQRNKDHVTSSKLEVTSLKKRIFTCSLIVNATPVGTVPYIEESPWLENLDLPAQACIYDLVYNPAETRLIHDARSKGIPARNGLGMLIEQAALAFERWTNQKVSRQELLKVLPEKFLQQDRREICH